MANYIKAIEFDSQLHQKQAVSHVMRSIELEFQKNQAALDLKTPLVQVIYEKLGHSNASVVQCCCNALLASIERGWIQFTGFLNGLLNIMPTNSHPGILLKCLGDLLCFELRVTLKANGDVYQCPYSIRGKRPHPFISATTSSPQLWLRLLTLTKELLLYPALECQSHVVDMLKPFIKYCLLVPSEEGLPTAMANRTFAMLTSVIHHYLHEATLVDEGHVKGIGLKVGQDIVSLLVAVLPCFQMRNSEQAVEVAGRAEELMCCLVRMAPWGCHYDLTGLLCDVVRSVVCELFVNQEHITLMSLLKSFCLLTKTHSKILLRAHNVFWLSWMLLSCVNLPSYVSTLLPQVQYLCEGDSPKELVLPFVLPLTVLLCSTKAGPTHHMINELLVQVNKKEVSNSEAKEFIAEATGMPTCTNELYSEICATAHLYCQLCCCSAQKSAWLESLQLQLEQQEVHISGDMRRLLLIMLSSVYLQQDTVTQLSTLEALRKFVKRLPNLCPEVLVFVQYLLSLQGSKELSLKLLYLLPALATHKVMVGRVVRVIHGLSQKISLYPVIIRLLCKVWHERDEVFSHLHKLLVAPLPNHTPPKLCKEITLAKVATIHDVCHSKPELHADEMIGLVLQFLTEFSLQNPSVSAGNDDGTTMAMSVKSLHSLCSAEMVDFPAAWNMIAPKLKGERRPKVLVAMCDMFSLIPTLEMDETVQPLCDTALTFLWNCAASTDGSVVEASFKALCHFQPEDFKLVYLPNKFLSLLECVDIATQENALILSGHQCVHLLTGISPDGFRGYSDFLAHILANEMEQFLRGVAHLTQNHFPQLERFTRDSSQCLSNFISDSNRFNNLKDFYFIGGLLMAFQLTEPERGSRGYQQQLSNVAKNYRAMWNQCLTVHVSLSAPVCLYQLFSLPYSWEIFMDRLYTVSVKSRLHEVCPANMRDNKTSPGYQQKQWEAECWVRCKLVEHLQTVCDNNCLCCIILSLCGMASTCLTLSDTVGSVEGSVAWLRDWSSSTFLAGILSMLANITAGKENCKEIDDDIFAFITKSFKGVADCSTVICIATIAAVQVIKHVANSFPLISLSANMKDGMVTIAANIFNSLNVSDEKSIITCYSLCEVLLVSCHQLPEISSLLSSVIRFCSMTSCNILSVCILGELIPLLCEERGWAHSVAKRLHKELVTGLVMSRYDPASIQFQVACLTVARDTPIMYIAGILTLADCKACVTILQGLASKLQKYYVVHLSLGTLLCGLVSGCIPNSHQMLNEVTAQWIAPVRSLEESTLLAGLYVMISSVGCCDALFSHLLGGGMLLQRHLKAVVLTCSTALFTVLAHNKAQEDLNHALWMIVQLKTSAAKPITSDQYKLPSNFSYLPQERALPAIFEYLSDSAGNQLEVATSSLLYSLSQCSSLPPVDWTGVLLSIIRKAPSLCQSCLQCALKLTKTSKGFHTFIVYCCTPLVLSTLETSVQQMILSKLYHWISDMSAPSLSDLLGSCSYACQRKKELLGSFVEGMWQALRLTDTRDTMVALLKHYIWHICLLLQQFPHLLDYAIHDNAILNHITECVLTTSTGDPQSSAISVETNIPNTTVLKSLIYSHLITSASHTHHNFLHSCLTALPKFTHSDHVLMGLINCILHSLPCINKQDLFRFLAQCMQESIQDSYVSKAEAQFIIKFAFLGSYGGGNSIEFWLGFLGNSHLRTADPHILRVHLNQLAPVLLSRLATSRSAPTNLKQLLSQWVIEMVLKNEDVKNFGNYVVLLPNAGSTLWPVWINLV